MDEPKDSGSNGQDAKGRFVAGNKMGRGNPQAKRMAELRQVFLEAATGLKIQALEQRLYKLAMENDDLAAFRLYFEYAMGKAQGAPGEGDAERRPKVIAPPKAKPA